MTFKETKLEGSFLIQIDKFEDSRGFFALSWSRSVFASRGLNSDLAECNISFNKAKGTIRGMHYQAAPHGQVKLVRCTMGSIYDIIIDLRVNSPTFRQWIGVELTSENRMMLYIPKDFAHGFQTLEDDTEVFYQMSQVYNAESGRGVRWNDPAFKITWPAPVSAINHRDAGYADFRWKR
jgi:dTDP-4-dehydrorhamnose 3,5-epimerase